MSTSMLKNTSIILGVLALALITISICQASSTTVDVVVEPTTPTPEEPDTVLPWCPRLNPGWNLQAGCADSIANYAAFEPCLQTIWLYDRGIWRAWYRTADPWMNDLGARTYLDPRVVYWFYCA